MRTPYFITNKNEFFNIIKPKLMEFGYKIRDSSSNEYNIIVLNDTDKFGIVSNYTGLENIDHKIDRYQETDIHQFLKEAAKLMNKEYRPFLKDVVHCSTEDLAKQVLYIADKLGYSWCSGKNFKGHSNWDIYKKETCYSIREGKFAFRSFYENNYNIIPAEEFINFYKEYLKDMEKRNISISLDEAKKWYKSGNNILKELALKAYSEEELNPINFSQIWVETCTESPDVYSVPIEERNKYTQLHKLSIIAKYFNKDWKKTASNTGYFIAGFDGKEIKINIHDSVVYPGLIYFKNKEDIAKAIKMIDINRLFN